ncbi:hypothetical protein Lmor_0616 [Legionella moravica]|uniref:Uncharacterized protein n=1 Tax=Legionella moravica TaxID=39962 RepID=A0A378K0E3_9GAMM|nr:hypothetical protein [Legionella moravica]KTD37424.1 hypothetical protein Lmor_0616 [Legionella moravica]STX63098.1 Uncharacterised protein [Legionella moravica]
MIAQHDSTLIPQESDSIALNEELNQLIAYIQLREKEFHEAEESFKPFILGTALNAIQKSLNSPTLQNIKTAHTTLDYLAEIIKIQSTIQSYLSELHNPLITKIVDSEFILLLNIATKALHESGELPLDHAWITFGRILKLHNQLTSGTTPSAKAADVKEALKTLSGILLSRELRQKIDEELNRFNSLKLEAFTEYNDLIEALNPIKERLIALNQEAQKEQVVDSIAMISVVLHQIDVKVALFMKRQLDNTIEQIQRNQWATVYNKQQWYFNILSPLNKVLNVFPLLEWSDEDKKNYINQLHAGYELCRDDDFLELLARCAKLFYSDKPEQLLPITQFITQSRDTVNSARSILKKKRVHFSEVEQTESSSSSKETATHTSKKPRLRDDDPTEHPQSLMESSFVNILSSVLKPEEPTSRKFTAAMLGALARAIWSIKDLDNSNKIIMDYDLIKRALRLCRDTEPRLLDHLNVQLGKLKERYARQLNDYEKFSVQHQNETGATETLTQDQFKHILSNLVSQIAIYIPPESMDCAIEQLVNKWMANLREAKFVSAQFIDQMENGIRGRTLSTKATSSSPSSSSSQTSGNRTFHSITSALISATPDELAIFLDTTKQKMADQPDYYLQYLTNPMHGKTPLHNALCNEQFHNQSNLIAYLNEIKALYGTNTQQFHSFLVCQTKSGFTFLHQIAALGSMDLLICFTDLLKKELGLEGYARALRIQTQNGFLPFCNSKVAHYQEINTFLETERRSTSTQRTPSAPDHHSFFRTSLEASSSTQQHIRGDYFSSSQ